MKSRTLRAILAGLAFAAAAVAPAGAADAPPRPDMPGAAAPETPEALEAQRNKMVMGCWGDADKGDSADLKLHFVGDGALVQYDENKTEKNKRTFGAWEMKPDSTYLVIYWPSGGITSYTVKRIGPILHFSGMNGARNFTLREIPPENCWTPEV